jgi:hypothetical protein
MRGNMEASRRHGPFDSRWPSQSSTVTAGGRAPLPAGIENGQDELEWGAFSTRCFPARRRHDFEVVGAYEAYKHGRGWPKRSSPEVQTADRRSAARTSRLSRSRNAGPAEVPLAGKAGRPHGRASV